MEIKMQQAHQAETCGRFKEMFNPPKTGPKGTPVRQLVGLMAPVQPFLELILGYPLSHNHNLSFTRSANPHPCKETKGQQHLCMPGIALYGSSYDPAICLGLACLLQVGFDLHRLWASSSLGPLNRAAAVVWRMDCMASAEDCWRASSLVAGGNGSILACNWGVSSFSGYTWVVLKRNRREYHQFGGGGADCGELQNPFRTI